MFESQKDDIIDFGIDMEQTPQVEEQVVVDKSTHSKTPKKKDPLPDAKLSELQMAITQSVVAAIKGYNQVLADNKKEDIQKKLLEQEYKYRDQAGSAAAKFCEQMEQEIANGDYIDWPYYNSNEKTGVILTHSINGYTITLVNNQLNRVPKSLVPSLAQFVKSYTSGGTVDNMVVYKSDQGLHGDVDTESTQQLKQYISHALNK